MYSGVDLYYSTSYTESEHLDNLDRVPSNVYVWGEETNHSAAGPEG